MVDQSFRFIYEGPKGQRLDKFLVENLPDYSRSRLQGLIHDGFIEINGVVAGKAGQSLDPGQSIQIRIPASEPSEVAPEAIPLQVVFENQDLMVIDKAAGMVVHPAAGHAHGTLVNAALAHSPEMEGIGGEQRPGVVHRLDKDTSGLILMAKNDRTHRWLQDQFRDRSVNKIYLALVDGHPPTASGRVEAPIGRDRSHRKQMAVQSPDKGRIAVSEYRTLASYPDHTLLEVHPLTGRTHQIRLHLAFLGCPIVGDKVYGRKKPTLAIDRQFLHAARLTIKLPGQDHPVTFEAPIPADLQQILDQPQQLNLNGRVHPMDFIDLRSDTVTQPTDAMRQAMAQAPVGDDVFGEDPTINRLQEYAAARMGKEAGLFVPSGTMGNLLAVLTHCGRGDEAIMGHLGHTFLFEGGGIAALGGINPHTITNQPDGTLNLSDIESAIRPDDIHQPPTRLVILENTHNRCGGVPLSSTYTREVGELAHQHGLKLHLDGARIFNAAASLEVPAQELAGPADTVTFCLSKGLCAPVGSVLCGSSEFIQRARRIRKQLGGGMRQAGILAAAGIVALDQMTERLREDHTRAKAIAQALSKIPGLVLDPGTPATNMIFLGLGEEVTQNAAQVAARLAECRIKVGVVGSRRFRIVCHYWIDDAAAASTVDAFGEVMRSL